MKHVAWIGVVLPAVIIAASGCATKSWVRQEMAKQDAEVNQRVGKVDQQLGEQAQRTDKRFETVEDRAKQDTQRVEGVTTRVTTLETSMTSTSEAARGAKERADAAMSKADAVNGRVTRLWNNRYNPRVVDTINVQFGFNRSELDDSAHTDLAGLVKELLANPGLTVELVGYTDTKGPSEYNYQLSQRRVDVVRRHLVEKGVQIARIQAVGLGALSDPAMPEAQKRRVVAKLMIDQD
jgi:outer membrane protein OmpA-like peptidoglycan-associated protein